MGVDMGHGATLRRTSSFRKMRISKSSEPTSNSSSPSSSTSQKVIVETLSPVTVQYTSAPLASKPWMEQFPPTSAIGVVPLSWSPNLPTTIVFTARVAAHRERQTTRRTPAPWIRSGAARRQRSASWVRGATAQRGCN